jgi:ankyrin repeat protein
MDDSDIAATRVYTAVRMGTSAQELRDVIEQCALAGGCDPADAEGIERRRRAAVNTPARPWRWTPLEHEGLPLQAASSSRRGDLICVLVELGADVEPAFGPWATPLAVCVRCGSDPGAAASVRALLRRPGADARALVQYSEKNGKKKWCTLAHYCVEPPLDGFASRAPRTLCLEALVRDGGADINALDTEGLTPLARLSDWIDGMKAMQAPRSVGGGGGGAESWPAALLALGADPNLCGEGPWAVPPALRWIFFAQPERQYLLVRWLRALLAAGARFSGGVFNGKGHTPLTLAARRGLHVVVRFLLQEARVDPHEPNRLTGALPLTCFNRIEPVVSALLAGGADAGRADRFGRRPLLHALSPEATFPRGICAPGVALALVRAGASLGVRGPRGETPLLMAAKSWPPIFLSDDRTRLLEELLRRTPEADRRATLEDGRSAVDLIVDEGGWLLDDDARYYYDVEDLDDEPDEFDSPLDTEGYGEFLEAGVARAIAAHRRIVSALVVAGAPVGEWNQDEVNEMLAAHAVPTAAGEAVRAARELAARRSEDRRWRTHDCVVGLALERRELDGAGARLEATRARLAALERAVAEAGLQSDDEDEGGREGE